MSNGLEVGHNMQTAAAMLRACLLRNIPAFLWGPSGIGKTDMTNQIVDDLGWGMVDETVPTWEPPDVRGQGFISGESLKYAKPDWLEELESFGDKPTILFLDEVNAGVSQAMLGATLKLILRRRAGPHPLPKNCRIVAAGNRAQDRAAVSRTTGPMNNRFSHIACVPDLAAWQTWANANAVEPLLCAFLNFQNSRGVAALHVPGDGGAVAWASPRSWVQAAKFIDEPKAIRVHLFASQVGDALAAEFEGFIELFKALPSLESIIADPLNAKLPHDAATAYAISAALSRKATRGNFAAIVVYAQRIGAAISREFETVAVLEAVKRDSSLKETGAYTAWAVRNADSLT